MENNTARIVFIIAALIILSAILGFVLWSKGFTFDVRSYLFNKNIRQ